MNRIKAAFRILFWADAYYCYLIKRNNPRNTHSFMNIRTDHAQIFIDELRIDIESIERNIKKNKYEQ